MNSRTRISIAVCAILCCLLLAMAVSAAISAPYKLYWEVAYWQGAGFYVGSPAGNPMAHAQQLIDGNKSIIAQGQGGLLVYADEQTNGTAFVKSTPQWSLPFPPNYATKGGCLLNNGHLYGQSDNGAKIHQSIGPLFAGGIGVAPDGPWGPGMDTGRDTSVDNDANALLTDGTYLYGSISGDGGSSIYKWSVDPAGNGGTGALTQVWKTDIATSKWFMCIGYYNGKLYAVENNGTDRNIYEIDCATGVATPILTAGNYLPDGNENGWVMGQIARCGNRIVVAAWSGHITQWELQGSTWVMVANDGGLRNEGYPDYLIGLSLKPGPDGNAKWAWVSGSNIVYFFDLTPFTGTPRNINDPYNWKPNYPTYAQAVVTAQGPAGTGFWVENQQRTMGAWVAWTGTMPTVGNLVTINATAAKNAVGGNVLTALDNTTAVTEGATASPALMPLLMTNKSVGPATDSKGLPTAGLLVTLYGKVTGNTYPDAMFSIYIDDGSGVSSGIATPAKGVKVCKADGTELFDVANIGAAVEGPYPCYAKVTGILRTELVGGNVIRRIDARSAADIVITVNP